MDSSGLRISGCQVSDAVKWNYFRKSKDVCRGKQKRETFCFYVLVNDTRFASNLGSLVVLAKKDEDKKYKNRKDREEVERDTMLEGASNTIRARPKRK